MRRSLPGISESNSDSEQAAIDGFVRAAEHIEHDSHIEVAFIKPLAHGIHGDSCCLFLRESENARADAAKCDRGKAVLGGVVEAASIARCKLLAVQIGRMVVRDGPTSSTVMGPTVWTTCFDGRL